MVDRLLLLADGTVYSDAVVDELLNCINSLHTHDKLAESKTKDKELYANDVIELLW